jgi:hypothetical protein
VTLSERDYMRRRSEEPMFGVRHRALRASLFVACCALLLLLGLPGWAGLAVVALFLVLAR